jgi:methyltransferase-like protein
MVSYEDKVRSKLATKVFGKLGKSVTLINKSTPLYNSRGELESSTTSSSTITAVPYNIINKSLEYEGFGDIQTGEMFVAIPYSVTVAVNDTLTIDTVVWEIKEIQENYLPGNVVTIVRIARKQA